jgi:hypothetical protein
LETRQTTGQTVDELRCERLRYDNMAALRGSSFRSYPFLRESLKGSIIRTFPYLRSC